MQAMPWNLEAVTVTLQEPVAQPDVSANVIRRAKPRPLPAFPNFLVKTLDIAEWEIRKLRHDPTDLFTRAVQPALWLVIFGEVFTRIRAIPTGQVRYLDFLAPGILAQSVLFISIFYGIAIIWERDLGVIHKFLASPIPRTTIVLGKAISAGVRALPQALIIYLLALLLGVQMNWNPLAMLGVILLVMLGAASFSTFSMIIACLLRTRDRVMGIGQVLTMPLFFASNAIYPITIMPGWLQAIAHGNPLTYVVDGIRMLMLAGGTVDFVSLGVDVLVLASIATVLVLICAALYPRIVQ
jgi:ABC-2 type transport system permease protein